MPQQIAHVTILVRDYDEAIRFFTESLGFQLIEDSPSKDRDGRDKRWVLVAPPGSRGTNLLLAKASNEEESSRIGAKGVKFVREPKEEEYGIVAVFEDLYGNRWDLLQPKS